MLLYMIRHGESEANASGTHSGWSPVHLTEKGRLEAAGAKQYMDKIKIDELYVSDVLRTQETADVIFPDRDRTFITIARELNNTPMHGKNKEQMTKLYGQIYLDCRKNFDYAPLNIDCESLKHLSGRAQEFLNWAAKKETQTLCVVSHAVFIKAVCGCILKSDSFITSLSCDNASISVFECTNGVWRLKTWNLAPKYISENA